MSQSNSLSTNYGKAAILITVAFIVALLLAEVVVKYLVHYPVMGLQDKVHYRNGGEYWTNVWKPYSRYWNVEGGNVVYSRNNFGLPGKDIKADAKDRIAVLGSSYLEAYQISPDKIACSVFSDLLNEGNHRYGVYNLGCSGHDPYDSYMRLVYFEPKIKPQTVILVINSDNYTWFQRHPKPLRFEPDKSFGIVSSGKLSQLQILLRNSSALTALYVNAFKPQKDDTETVNTHKVRSNFAKPESLVISEELTQTLEKFRTRYPKFITISILTDTSFNNELSRFCNSQNIAFYSAPLLISKNMLNGAGHLNENGNKKLGELMYNSYIKSLQKENVLPDSIIPIP